MVRDLTAQSLQEKWAKRYSSQFVNDEDRLDEQLIADIPILFGLDGSIICIPRRQEPNNIAIVGKKGTGKTLILHRIADEIFWLWNEATFIMNDVQEECMSWNNHQENTEWRNQLETIDEEPLALPIVYIYPHTNSLNLDYSHLKNEINFVETTIPFHEVVLNNENFIKSKITTSFINEENIMDKIKKQDKPSIAALGTEDRIKVITAAVNEYLRKKNNGYNNKQSEWVTASRQEAINSGNLEEQ